MENKYFSLDDTLLDITEKYPETIPVFISRGIGHMADETKRKTFGASVTLRVALTIKQLSVESFSEALVEQIEQEHNLADASLKTVKVAESQDAIRIEGLLPCPVRIPLMEQMDSFTENFRASHNREIRHDLKAASMGLDWLKSTVVNEDDPAKLPDVFISAGFDLFFEKHLMGKFKERNVFADNTGFKRFNRDFDNDEIDLKDPAGHYSMIGVVPAVFLVNTEELNGRPVPQSWKDILKPEYEKSISLPIGDFDLFNAILLNIHKKYGESAVMQLGRSLLESMHPSQMVKSHRKKNAAKPVVTIMPYFFTRMVKEGGPMIAVWPEDGAIISPIFMLTKRDKADELQPVVDFFASKEIGETLAHKGLFPSIHPSVDNQLKEGNTFMWIGWDYIYNNDIGKLIGKCESLFNSAIKAA